MKYKCFIHLIAYITSSILISEKSCEVDRSIYIYSVECPLISEIKDHVIKTEVLRKTESFECFSFIHRVIIVLFISSQEFLTCYKIPLYLEYLIFIVSDMKYLSDFVVFYFVEVSEEHIKYG